MNVKTSQAAEDYLKAIYELTRAEPRASNNKIAERMGVSPAAATGMIQKLAAAQPPLVEYEKHRGAALTLNGERIALEVIRHHRLLETFLLEKLGYTWDEVHAEADRLEHVISEEMEERIARVLGHPEVDPHGDPIPNHEFQMPAQPSTSLSALRPGDQVTVVRINTDDNDLLRYLANIGLRPGSQLAILDVSPFDGNVRLHIRGQDQQLVLGPRITTQIFVLDADREPPLRQEVF